MQGNFQLSLARVYKQKYAKIRSKENKAQAVNDSEINYNYPKDNPVAQIVQNGTTASGPETENASETSSAKQKREEKMKKFDIELKTKIQLERAMFERRRLELEMQMKELESSHQQLEEERELERKVMRLTLENDDCRSQSTSARDNWTPKKRGASDWASRIDLLLTPDRSTARFEATPEVNRHSHFTRYRNSRDRSSSVQDRDVSPRAGISHNSGYSGSSSLPKLKLNNFEGDPLGWP